MTAPAASGIFRQLRIDAETNYGVAPAQGDVNAYILRRTSCQLDPNITTFKSNEIRPDRQLVTFRHGTQTVRGTLRGELSPTSYKDMFASLLAGAFAAGATETIDTTTNTITYTAAVVATSPGKISRTSGSWIAGSKFKKGDIVRLSGSSITANNARNYRITALTALDMSVGPTPTATVGVGNETVVAGSQTSGSLTVAVAGKKLITPDPFAGGTLLDPSFTLEQYFSDQAIYELYTGCKPTDIRMSFAPSALCTIESTFMGHGFTEGSGQYFTAAGDAAVTDATSGVTGLIRIGDQDLALVTNMQMTIAGGHTVDPVIGSVFVPFVFPGIIDINGTMSLLFADETQFNEAINETEVDLFLMLNLGTTVNTDFISFSATRVKLNSVTKDDGPKAIIGTYAFSIQKQVHGGDGTALDNTTLSVQDSTL